MARMLSNSTIVPEQYRGPDHLGDCVIALEIANRIGASVLAVMQNLDIIYGRPSWRAQFLISCLNASRRFSPLRYRISPPGPEEEITYSYNRWEGKNKVRAEGKVKIRNQTCVAWAYDKATGEVLESPEVSIRMAVEEGWYMKDGSKWKTMSQLMLSYRSAAFFTRVYSPELTMGIQTADEAVDTHDLEPKVQPATSAAIKRGTPKFAAADEAATAAPESAPGPEAAAVPAVASNAAQEQPEAKPTTPTAPMMLPDPQRFDRSTPQGQLGEFMEDNSVSFEAFRKWAGETERLPDADSFASWDQLPADFCRVLKADTKSVTKCITRCKS